MDQMKMLSPKTESPVVENGQPVPEPVGA
jgi:hypothetical protein